MGDEDLAQSITQARRKHPLQPFEPQVLERAPRVELEAGSNACAADVPRRPRVRQASVQGALVGSDGLEDGARGDAMAPATGHHVAPRGASTGVLPSAGRLGALRRPVVVGDEGALDPGDHVGGGGAIPLDAGDSHAGRGDGGAWGTDAVGGEPRRLEGELDAEAGAPRRSGDEPRHREDLLDATIELCASPRRGRLRHPPHLIDDQRRLDRHLTAHRVLSPAMTGRHAILFAVEPLVQLGAREADPVASGHVLDPRPPPHRVDRQGRELITVALTRIGRRWPLAADTPRVEGRRLDRRWLVGGTGDQRHGGRRRGGRRCRRRTRGEDDERGESQTQFSRSPCAFGGAPSPR